MNVGNGNGNGNESGMGIEQKQKQKQKEQESDLYLDLESLFAATTNWFFSLAREGGNDGFIFLWNSRNSRRGKAGSRFRNHRRGYLVVINSRSR